MNPKDLFLLSFEALVDRKVRTLLTILMVVLGSSLVVVLNGLSAGQAAFLEKQFNTLAANVLFVGSGQRGFRDASAGNAIIINTVIVNKIKSLPLVSDVIPEYTGSVSIDSQGNTQRVSVTSIDPTKLIVELPNLEYVDGSTVKANDRSSAIVGDTIVNPPGAANAFVSLGQTIRATATYADSSGKSVTVTKNFVVTGILKPSGNTMIDRSVIINLDAGNDLLHKVNKYDQLIVAAATPDDVDTVQNEITGQFGKTLGATTPKAIIAVRQQAASGNAAFILMVGIIALVVGAVGIVTTLYNSVTERIREIGTMKAIGAQNSTILALFIVEASLIGLFGASLGMIIGIGGGYIMSIATTTSPAGGGPPVHIPPIFDPIDLIKVWLLSLTLSIVAGMYPAWKASKLSPMVALRRE
ncbi:ABC efflux transporter, FtsX-domain permease protein [Nitrosotalea sinensis]|uniref:ABC efflux transporter, FtsX-domain permease protein n=1 Tax=Nitrosotalea sinensis TaxID=1499975 RepID=A0A2H1EJ22_9ARCH|nr:FtsX-like permease family protein [Candidatus Nitrosotalea sinensis]SHO48029.1 ABC efflux transporter, FtsX-domain permease protein [Candidatus Nitrosotalea sinensis]